MDNFKKEFTKIYDKNIDKIYRFVFLKVNSQEIAEDLTSETFLRGWKVYQKAQNPDKQKIENIQAFLYKIARNLVTDYYREKGKVQIVSAEYSQIEDPRTNLEEKVVLKSDMETIRGALSRLKENYQDVIIWHYLDQFSTSEIAQIMDKSEGAVRVTLHRALGALRNELKEV